MFSNEDDGENKLLYQDSCLKIHNNNSNDSTDTNIELLCSVLMQVEMISGKFSGLYRGSGWIDWLR